MTKVYRAELALVLGAWAALAFGSKVQATPMLTLEPSNGAVAGPAGTTTGWGFTLTNTSDFAVITGSDFCTGMLTSPCTNSFGTYTDFAGAQFLVVGPSPEQTSITQSFDNSLMTGMGSFAINPGSVGTLNGYIAMTYDLYSVSPNAPDFDPITDTLETGQYLYAPASVTVGQITPEPASLLLFVSGLGVLWLRKKPCMR